MNVILVFSIFISVSLASPLDKYTSKYDGINLDEVLKNERLLNAYFKCLKDGTSCTPEGDELKRVLPDAIQTGCKRCTEVQRIGAKRVAAFLIKEKSQMWDELIGKYDPDKTYRIKFRDQLKAEYNRVEQCNRR